MLKKIFDTFDTLNYVYTSKIEDGIDNISKLYMSQNRNNQIISHKIENILPINISYVIITAKNIEIIKGKLEKLYEASTKNNIFIEISLLNNGFSYKVYDVYNDNKLIYTDKIIFKSFFNIIYYMIYLIKQRS
jgi:hypothetical protein